MSPKSPEPIDSQDSRTRAGIGGDAPVERATFELTIEQLRACLVDYEVLRLIGSGAMGVVYEANHKPLQRRVALKVLPPGLASREATILRFLREAEVVAKIHHEHIVPIYDVGSKNGLHYLAMRFVPGVSLDKAIAVAPLAPREVAEIGAAIAKALAFAHRSGIVHRDVKPANILRETDGRVVLTDFGLARVEGSGTMTESGALVGTPNYMAPEQISGNRESVDGRSDIFSLGVTLFELLTGKPPFQENTTSNTLRSILEKPTPRLRKLRPDCPVALEVILGKAMRKDPVARYPNAQALADDLERFLRGVPILARKESLWVRSSRIVRENRFPIMAAVAVVLAAGVVLSYINFDKQAGETALQSARARMDEARPDTIHLVKQDLEEAHAHRNTRLAACRERAQFALRVGTADRSLLETAFRDTAELVASANQSADEQTIAYVLRGNVALRLGEFAEAETCARKAQELRPDHTHVLTLVAELMKESGRKFAEGGDGSEARSQWLLARDLLLRAIKVDEKFAKAHLELASVYELLEMHDDAHREFDLAIKYDPKDSEARSRYAAFQSGRGNQETANTQLEFAKALNPFAIFTRDTPLLGDEVANSIRRYGSTFRNILPVADGTPDQGSAESRTAAESGPASRPQKSL